MCETANDKNVNSEEICFAIRSETTAVKSSLVGGNCLGIFNAVLNYKIPGK